MTAYISPFDNRFLTLGRAARLAAENHPGLDSADVMDMLARAVFAGAFDPPSVDGLDARARRAREAQENWPHILIDTPAPWLTPAQAKLSPKPQQYFGANRLTIASVMQSAGGLPGAASQWRGLLHDLSCPEGQEEAFAALVKTPLAHYPEAGRRFLESIYIPREKLRCWFALREIPVSQFLYDGGEPADTEHLAADRPSPEPPSRGRPQKAAWRCVTQTLLKLRAKNPAMQQKAMAYEAWKRAAQEFDEAELPSVTTIQRKMGEILRAHSH
ncbi:MAG: hypothetical protein R3C51_03295 [Parvularculaceae bacterium]